MEMRAEWITRIAIHDPDWYKGLFIFCYCCNNLWILEW